jgi:hypothetical protein
MNETVTINKSLPGVEQAQHRGVMYIATIRLSRRMIFVSMNDKKHFKNIPPGFAAHRRRRAVRRIAHSWFGTTAKWDALLKLKKLPPGTGPCWYPVRVVSPL